MCEEEKIISSSHIPVICVSVCSCFSDSTPRASLLSRLSIHRGIRLMSAFSLSTMFSQGEECLTRCRPNARVVRATGRDL